jgi:hypothetical protein
MTKSQIARHKTGSTPRKISIIKTAFLSLLFWIWVPKALAAQCAWQLAQKMFV